jgi:hypothetical protein
MSQLVVAELTSLHGVTRAPGHTSEPPEGDRMLAPRTACTSDVAFAGLAAATTGDATSTHINGRHPAESGLANRGDKGRPQRRPGVRPQ